MNDPCDDKFEDDYLSDTGYDEDGNEIDELDDDSLYLDEADRGTLLQPQEKAGKAQVRTRGLESMPASDQIENRKHAIQKRINAAQMLAIRDARRHLKFVRVVASRELRTISLPRHYRSQALRYLMCRFVACAAAQARQNSAALTTPNNTFQLCYKTILHCSFTALADRGYCTYSQAVAIADKLVVSLGLEKASISLGNQLAKEEYGPGVFDPELGFEPVGDNSYTQDIIDGYSDVPISSGEPSQASTAQIRACSISLRQAARYLLKVERQLDAITRLRP